MSGSLHAVLTAIFLTLEKCDDGRGGPGRKESLRLAVNRRLVGGLIGASVRAGLFIIHFNLRASCSYYVHRVG